MIYSKIRSMQGFWILGKIVDHAAFPLDATDIDNVVEQLTSCASLSAEIGRLRGIEERAKECCRRYFYDDDADFDDVVYDAAMHDLRTALAALKG